MNYITRENARSVKHEAKDKKENFKETLEEVDFARAFSGDPKEREDLKKLLDMISHISGEQQQYVQNHEYIHGTHLLYGNIKLF